MGTPREASGVLQPGPSQPRRAASQTGEAIRRRLAFTLVELLVVISIIGMLMAMLLPAIQSAREAGRRNTCSNNMRNVGQALISVEATRRGFPGYANIVNNKRASWVVPILTNLERADVYRVWQTQAPMAPNPALPTTSNPWAHTLLNILICPSDPAESQGTNPLSYVVNCGSDLTANDLYPPVDPTASTNWTEDINSGIFFNHAKADWTPMAPNPNPAATTGFGLPSLPELKVTIDFISTNDGTSNTLILSENLQARNWATNPEPGTTGYAPWASEFQIKKNTGFVFFLTEFVDSATSEANNRMNPAATNFLPQAAPINGNSTVVPDPATGEAETFDLAMRPYRGLACARPSSAHPGGVNAFFCDNHYRFLSEEMDYKVYTQLMTPKQSTLRLNLTGNTPTNPPAAQLWNYILSEADY